ncbi:hypothetical protein M0805_007877 [Coniferiporia weirii]|nr:hypothetical protein M0805_007877 [Coniferiporia weirii]
MGGIARVYRKEGPGKYVARLGLSFSSTIKSIYATSSDMVEIKDVSAGDGVLTTDGCGVIRESIAKEIRKSEDLAPSTSVFQIRLGGIKGLLVAYPDHLFNKICDTSRIKSSRPVPGRQPILAYRNSMRKYHGGPTNIEIQNISEPSSIARLNHAFIVLLLSLHVNLKAFKELLKKQLRSIHMIPYDRQEALRYVEGELDAQGESFNQELFEMLHAGHSMKDSFLRAKLRRFQNLQYDSLKKKLNIRVQKSCYVYGVVDGLGILKEDEVYINLPHREGIVVSPVLVAKAVDAPELEFLTNCIVFPLRGGFSVPGSMSGGDLDGDKYFVSWEPSILPRVTENPVTQGPPRSANVSSDPRVNWVRTRRDRALVELYVKQHHNKVLSFASREWQFAVEKYPKLARAEYSRELAVIIEEALDVTKSGGDYDSLEARFESLRRNRLSELEAVSKQNRKTLLDRLRDMIPARTEDIDIQYTPDPELNLRQHDPSQWDVLHEEGSLLIDMFNKKLSIAIEADDKAKQESDERIPWKESRSLSRADQLKKTFIDKYFPPSRGFLSYQNLESFMRASAWYDVGYKRGKPTFAWLGARYLNQIKAYETNGGRPGFAVGAHKRPMEEQSTGYAETVGILRLSSLRI